MLGRVAVLEAPCLQAGVRWWGAGRWCRCDVSLSQRPRGRACRHLETDSPGRVHAWPRHTASPVLPSCLPEPRSGLRALAWVYVRAGFAGARSGHPRPCVTWTPRFISYRQWLSAEQAPAICRVRKCASCCFGAAASRERLWGSSERPCGEGAEGGVLVWHRLARVRGCSVCRCPPRSPHAGSCLQSPVRGCLLSPRVLRNA